MKNEIPYSHVTSVSQEYSSSLYSRTRFVYLCMLSGRMHFVWNIHTLVWSPKYRQKSSHDFLGWWASQAGSLRCCPWFPLPMQCIPNTFHCQEMENGNCQEMEKRYLWPCLWKTHCNILSCSASVTCNLKSYLILTDRAMHYEKYIGRTTRYRSVFSLEETWKKNPSLDQHVNWLYNRFVSGIFLMSE